jgi:5-methylcytosine-specific restriction endonuclease McrA
MTLLCVSLWVFYAMPYADPEKRKQYHAEYKIKNAEKLKALSVIYRETKRETIRAKDNLYKKNNRDKINAQAREYREQNRVEINARNKIYRANNRKQLSERRKEKFQLDRERILDAQNERRVKNYAHYRQRELKYYRENKAMCHAWAKKRRAVQLAIGEPANPDKTFRAETLRRFKNACFNCGTVERLNLDHHVPLHRGAKLELTNAVVLCAKCNSRKARRMPREFYTEKQLKKLENTFGVTSHLEREAV